MKFQVKKMPSLIVMKMDNSTEEIEKPKKEKGKEKVKQLPLKVAQYTGRYNYDDLSRYLSVFLEKKEEEVVRDTGGEEKKIHELKKKEKFDKYCQEESCYMLLVNGGPESNNEQNTVVFKKAIVGAFERAALVDGVCHNELLLSMDIMVD